MISSLLKYAETKDLWAVPGFKSKDVRWAIALTTKGVYTGVVELGKANEKNNKGITFSKAPNLSQPEMKAGGVLKSHFLIDTADVVALWDGKGEEPHTDQKVQAKHQYFITLLEKASEVMPELELAAGFLANDDNCATLRKDLAEKKAKATDKVTLQIGGKFPVESEAWHQWWQKFRAALPVKKSEASDRVCFATGELVEPANTHPKVTGLGDVGGNTSGTTLIGFDKEAFESYGLSQSANAAMGEEAAQAYRSALDHLLKHQAEKLAGAKVVYWFKKEVQADENPFAILFAPHGDEDKKEKKAQEAIKALTAQQHCAEFLQGVQKGQFTDLAGNEYYALTLSGAGGRIMVRDWMQGSFETLASNVLTWFKDLEIVRRDGGGLAPWPKFEHVVAATARKNREHGAPASALESELKTVPAPVSASLWRVALEARPIPINILARVLARVKVDIVEDQAPNHARLGLIKAYHLRKARQQGGIAMSEEQLLKPYLNENHPEPAYHCGRLMAVLADLQRSALGDVGAGIVQRYYAAASSTPALVLGRLIRLSNFHLAKLDNPGLAWWYQDKLASIWGRIKDTIPRTLDLEQQSLFAMGYYQQLADLHTSKSHQPTDNETEQKEGEN